MTQAILTEKLLDYLVQNNPDILLGLQKDLSVTKYLEDRVSLVVPLAEQLAAEGKPPYIIEEVCMNELTADLRPSKFNYIREVLETEFLQTCNRFQKLGVLTYEIHNLIEACAGVFEHFGFTKENENDRSLRYVVIGTISEYLENN